MDAYLLVALGSAAGGMCRFWLASRFDGQPTEGFYWGTLGINVLGCLIIGVVAAASEALWVRHLLMVGVLGGFTTFSAFSLQALRLTQADRWGAAAAYVLASVALCLVAVWLGFLVMRALRPLAS